MNALLVRVGADQTQGGGSWNAPVDFLTDEFAYVPIPEAFPIHRRFAESYSLVCPFLKRFGVTVGRERSHTAPFGKGRSLSKAEIAHYHEIAIALAETIRLTSEIDKTIDKHGAGP